MEELSTVDAEQSSRLANEPSLDSLRSSEAFQDTKDSPSLSYLRKALETLSLVAGPPTLLGAILFYFGWIRTEAVYSYFSIDPSILGFSTQDYLLHSVIPILPPLIVSSIVTLLVIWAHRWLQSLDVGTHLRRLRLLSRVMMLIGVILTVFAFSALTPLFDSFSISHFLAAPFLTPLAVAFGPAAMNYSLHLRQMIMGPSMNQRKEARWQAPLTRTFVSLLVLCGTIGFAGEWADFSGIKDAEAIGKDVACQYFGAVIYSKEQLNLNANDVRETAIPDERSVYRFRYTGLVLIIHSGGKFFLLPESWTPSTGTTIVLADSDSLRMEFTPTRCKS